jgi:hypothetical protein
MCQMLQFLTPYLGPLILHPIHLWLVRFQGIFHPVHHQ